VSIVAVMYVTVILLWDKGARMKLAGPHQDPDGMVAIRSVIGSKEKIEEIIKIKGIIFKAETTRTRRSPTISWKRSPRGRPVPRDFPLVKWKTIEPD
jgi:hypothetical protein